MRRAVLLICLISAAAGASIFGSDPLAVFDAVRNGLRDLFGFLPPSGAGAGVVLDDLCDKYASEIVGPSALCMRPDGGSLALQADGGSTFAISAVNNPTLTSWPTCPNGVDCGATLQSVRTNKASPGAYKTASTINPTRDVSMCYLGTFDSFAAEQIFGKWNDGNTGGLSFGVDVLTTGQPKWYVGDGGVSTPTTGTAMTAKATHLICGTYQYGANTDGVLTSYLDGVAGASISNAAEIMPRSFPISVGAAGNMATTFAVNGTFRNFIWTEKVLAAATIAAMAADALPSLKGSAGEAITVARNSAEACVSTGGSLSTVATNKPCVVGGALQVEPSGTNNLLRPRDQSQTWTLTNVTCAHTATGVDNVPNAATLCTATADGGTVTQIVGQSGARTTSVFINPQAFYDGYGLIHDADAGTFTAMSSSNCYHPGTLAAMSLDAGSWSRCALTATVTSPTVGVRFARYGDSAILDFAQDEAGSVATSPCDGLGSTCTRAAQTAALVVPAGMTDSAGCVSAWFYPRQVVGTDRVFGTNSSTNSPLNLVTSTSASIFDGTNQPTTSNSSLLNRWVFGRAAWSSAGLSVTVDGVTATGSYDGALLGANLYLGSHSNGTSALTGFLKDAKAGGSVGGCQQ